jgi:hypothetical protein
MVGPQGDDDDPVSALGDQSAEELPSFLRVLAQREQLLALVDQDRSSAGGVRERGQRLRGVGAGGDHHDGLSATS